VAAVLGRPAVPVAAVPDAAAVVVAAGAAAVVLVVVPGAAVPTTDLPGRARGWPSGTGVCDGGCSPSSRSRP